MKLLSFKLVPILVALVAVLILVGIFLPGVATSGANNPPTTTTSTTSSNPSSLVVGTTGSNNVVYLSSSDPSCPSGKTCIATLTAVNTGCLDGTSVTVTIDNTGSPTILDVSATPPSGTTVKSIVELGYQSSSLVTSVSAGTWDLTHQGPKTLDGFGSFLNAIQQTAGSKNTASVDFTLATSVTSFSPNSDGNLFAVHILLANGCTGFVSGVQSFIVTPQFPLGTLLALVAPLAAVGIYFGARKGFKF